MGLTRQFLFRSLPHPSSQINSQQVGARERGKAALTREAAGLELGARSWPARSAEPGSSTGAGAQLCAPRSSQMERLYPLDFVGREPQYLVWMSLNPYVLEPNTALRWNIPPKITPSLQANTTDSRLWHLVFYMLHHIAPMANARQHVIEARTDSSDQIC